ncbi:MAG: TolC family outer membrane protein [Pseudomonadota bacterium]
MLQQKQLISVISSALFFLSSVSYATGLLEVYKIALDSDPILKQAIANQQSVNEQSTQTFSTFLPTISASASSTEKHSTGLSNGSSSYNNSNVGLSLRQSIYDNKNYVSHRISKLNLSSANSDLISANQDLMSRVTNSYLDVLLAADTVAFNKSEQKAIGRQLEQAKRRYEVGIIAITDVLEAQAGYDNSTASVLKAENDFQISRELLRDIAGQYFDQLSPVSDNMPLNSPQPANIDEWVKYALATNPTLQSINYQKESSRENITLQRSGHYPTFDLVASHTEIDNGGNSITGDRNGSDSAIGLEISIPLYQGGFISSKTRQAFFDLNNIENKQEEIKRTTERQARNSYLSLVSEISRVKALKQAVISNQSALKATEAGFEVGTRTIVDVLNVQRDRFAAKKNHSEARYNYIRATIFLKKSAGLLEEKDISKIGQYTLDLLEGMVAYVQNKTGEQNRELIRLSVPVSLWVARHGGKLSQIDMLVNSLAGYANEIVEPHVLAKLAAVIKEVIDACDDEIRRDVEQTNMMRPWRVLNLNYGIVATRSHQPAQIEQAYDALVKNLPQDARQFFKEGMQQMDIIGYPDDVREVVERYNKLWGSESPLH